MEKTLSNAKRFINAYNTIDYSMRTIYNMKRSLTFADAVRRCASLNSVIRKYEDRLIDYGRLRNSIVHGHDENYIIAEPHDRVVEEIEKISDLIAIPPLAITLAATHVFSVDASITLKEAINIFDDKGFSNLPVLDRDCIIGVLNSAKIVEFLGQAIKKGKDINHFINTAKLLDIMGREEGDTTHYTIRKDDLTIEEALNLFFNNRKLSAIIMTKQGNYLEKPIGILTTADIIDMNHVLENY